MKLYLLIATLLLTSGCSNLAPTIKALSTDHALTTIDARSIYGVNFRLVRDGRVQNGTTISEGGAITSTPPSTNVPNPTPFGFNLVP